MSEENKQITKEEIVEIYFEIVKVRKRLPTYSDFYDYEISRDKIRRDFGNLTKFHSFVEEKHADRLNNVFAHESQMFDPHKLENLRRTDKKVFIITTAVAEKKLFEKGYDAVKHYLRKRNGELILLPSADIWNRSKHAKLVFDAKLSNEAFIYDDISLNSKLFVSSIRVSAKQIGPTTGLQRIGQRNGSYIFASPKQFLEHVATGSDPHKMSHAIMTPGAITLPNYEDDRYMAQRLSYIAEHDHVMGGIIVEIENNRTFHFRQFQFLEDGSFVDFNKRYFSDGTEEFVNISMVGGDLHLHPVTLNTSVFNTVTKFCKEYKVSDFFAHDMFDGYSISHHDFSKVLKLGKKSYQNNMSLENEIRYGGKKLNMILDSIKGRIIRVKSNHDEFVEKWLEPGHFVRDFQNQRLGVRLADEWYDGEDPLKYAYKKYGEIENFDRIIWLQRDSDYKISGIECGKHGDKGPGQSAATLRSLEKAYGNCFVGHGHSAAILRGVWMTGTFSHQVLEYSEGHPNNKTNSFGLISDFGTRQLVNIINGKYKIE